MHGETLWSPAPQPMDDDDERSVNSFLSKTFKSVANLVQYVFVQKTFTQIVLVCILLAPMQVLSK